MKKIIILLVLFLISTTSVFSQITFSPCYQIEVGEYFNKSFDNEYIALEKKKFTGQIELFSTVTKQFALTIPFEIWRVVGSSTKISYSSDNQSLYLVYYKSADGFSGKPESYELYKYNYKSNKTEKHLIGQHNIGSIKCDYQNIYYGTENYYYKENSIRNVITDSTLLNFSCSAFCFNHYGETIAYIAPIPTKDDSYNPKFDIIIQDIESKKILKKSTFKPFGYGGQNNIEYSPDDKLLVYTSNRCVFVLNSSDLTQKYSFEFPHSVSSICFSSDNRYLICGEDYYTDYNRFFIYDLSNGKLVAKSSDYKNSIISMFFTPDARYLITVEKSEYSKVIKYWDFISMIYSQQIVMEINKKPELFNAKYEFETLEQYQQRQQKGNDFKSQLCENFHQDYLSGLKNNKATIEQEWALRNEKIKTSYSKVSLQITTLGNYNSDKQYFPISVGQIEDNIYIPISEAKSFKENIKSVIVTADKQLLSDLVTWDIFNIRVVHPITGSAYLLRPKNPLCFNNVLADNMIPNNEMGIPKLSTEIKFIEPSGNNLLDGEENAKFEITVKNTGDGPAKNVNINLSMPPIPGITYEKNKLFTGIAPNQSQTTVFEVTADRKTENNSIQFKFAFTEARGFKPGDINYTINTQAYKAP